MNNLLVISNFDVDLHPVASTLKFIHWYLIKYTFIREIFFFITAEYNFWLFFLFCFVVVFISHFYHCCGNLLLFVVLVSGHAVHLGSVKINMVCLPVKYSSDTCNTVKP